MRFELFISRRYFKSKPKGTLLSLITLLSIAGVTIGVTALIVVIGVMAGFETDLKTRIMGIEPHLVIDRNGEVIQDYGPLVAEIRSMPGVRAAWPLEELQVMLKSDARVAIAVIKGVDPIAAGKGLNLDQLNRLDGDADPGGQPTGAPPLPRLIMGRDLARNLGLLKGESLFVISPQGKLAPIGFVPYMKRFVLADVFQTGMYEYDGGLAFINLQDAQALSRSRGAVGAIEVRVDEVLQSSTIKDKLTARLGEGFRFRDWSQLNKNLFSALKLEKAAMFITLTLITLVATFSITSSLVMMVMEKIKDIAILRTLGATSTSIRRIFVLQGMLIGAIGTAAGVLLGVLLCYLQSSYGLIRLPGDVYYISALPVDLKAMDVVLVALSALTISFVATLYPARQASRLRPVEAIRYG
jgi:lipoprotein-releasing system permease protein